MENLDLVRQGFDEFVKLSGKAPAQSNLDEYSTFEEVEFLDDVGVHLLDHYVILDFDSLDEFYTVIDILKHTNTKSRIMRSTRGGHIWFKSPEPLTNNTGANTPVTLEVDVKSYGKRSYAVIKQDGIWREWIHWDDEVDNVPFWLQPMHHNIKLFGLKEGDGRNQELFNYIITLRKEGLDKDQIKLVFGLINDFIFREPMDAREFEQVTRDEAFDNIKPMFFDGNRFLHDEFANFIKNEDSIFTDQDRLYVYKDGVYSDNHVSIERKMINHIPGLNSHQRMEVIRYLTLISDDLGQANKYKIAVENGTIDIRGKGLMQHSPNDYLRNKLQVKYDPDAYCENVDNVLDKITCYDEDLRSLVEEMIGYIIISNVDFHKAFILFGEGSNGKSTLINMINALVGSENVSSLTLEELNHNFKLSEITNKLANIGDDISNKNIDDSSTFKRLVSGDEITVDKKNTQPYKIRNYAALLFATNHMPQFDDTTTGLLRRLIIIPFDARFSSSDDDFDPFIEDKVTSENAKAYLLNLAVEGIIRVFQNNEFTTVARVEQIREEFQLGNNNALVFLQEYDKIEGTPVKELYSEYTFWAMDRELDADKYREFNAKVRNLSNYEPVNSRVDGELKYRWTIKQS